LEPQAETGSGGDDVVMVPVDQGAPLPLPTMERDVAAPEVSTAGTALPFVAPETLVAGTTPPTEGAEDMSMSRYVTIPGIGVIDFDTAKLPSNDREILRP
jgi:hypothetical protein